MAEQISRRHHFLSQCCLAGFTDTGTKRGILHVFDLASNETFPEKPKRVAYEIDFNRVDIEGHRPDVLEQAFGSLEDKAALALRWIRDHDDIPPDEEFSYVLNLIALIAVRNPAGRRSMLASRQHAQRIIGDLLASDRRLYEHHLKKAYEAGFVPRGDVPFEQMQSVLRAEHQLSMTPQEHLGTELAVFQKILNSLGARHWSVLVAAVDAPDFVTCDHPTSLVYKQTIFPIGSRHALLGDREKPWPEKVTLPAKGVAEVNGRIVNLADRQIFSRAPEVTLLVDEVPARVSFADWSQARKAELANLSS